MIDYLLIQLQVLSFKVVFRKMQIFDRANKEGKEGPIGAPEASQRSQRKYLASKLSELGLV